MNACRVCNMFKDGHLWGSCCYKRIVYPDDTCGHFIHYRDPHETATPEKNCTHCNNFEGRCKIIHLQVDETMLCDDFFRIKLCTVCSKRAGHHIHWNVPEGQKDTTDNNPFRENGVWVCSEHGNHPFSVFGYFIKACYCWDRECGSCDGREFLVSKTGKDYNSWDDRG